MRLMLRRPGTPWLDSFRNEMDEMLQRFFSSGSGDANGTITGWTPQVDIEETDSAMLVKADLPGVDVKDVDISIQDRTLTLKGEKHEERQDKTKQFHRLERFAGSFYRSVPLPADADLEHISATAKKGVVTITIPKSPGSQPRKVMVKEKE